MDPKDTGFKNDMFKVIAISAPNHKAGTHVNLTVPWFSLRLDGHDRHALAAIETYAKSCASESPNLSQDLKAIARRARERIAPFANSKKK